MNFIGIDVSQGKSHATQITDEFEKRTFAFNHNKSGFNDLSTHFTSDTCIIFETTGYYSNALTRYLQQKHIKFIELNPFEASLRMAELRRNKNDSNDSFKLAMLGITQYDEIKFRGRQYSDGSYKNLKKYCLNYLYLQKCQTRAINHLRSLIELSFPELNSIFVHASSVMALQMFRMYAHPDFLVGLTVKNMVDRLYQIIGKHINRTLIEKYCAKVWLAAKGSYPSIEADDPIILLIFDYCDEIEAYNNRLIKGKKEVIRRASKFKKFRIITSIPGTGQLSTALLLGFTGDLNRFSIYKQLNAFLEVDLNRYQSGKFEKRDKINRRGSSQGRYIESNMIRSMLRNQARINNHIIDYYYKMRKPPYSKKDKVALIACVNHLNRTIINLVHTNQLYDYQKAIH